MFQVDNQELATQDWLLCWMIEGRRSRCNSIGGEQGRHNSLGLCGNAGRVLFAGAGHI